MKILVYRYNSIYEPFVIEGFKKLGFCVQEVTAEIYKKNISPQEQLEIVNSVLKEEHFDFVFSINYFPVLSEICNIYRIKYASWIVDAPVLELFSNSIKRVYNRIFIFDYIMYQKFYPKNPDCIFYLPLGASVSAYDKICKTITPEDRNKFSHDISFVGSLYTEKCPYNQLQMDSELKGYFDGIIEAQLKVYGYNFLDELISDLQVEKLKQTTPVLYPFPEAYEKDEKSVLADYYIGNKVTEQERLRLLGTLSKYFKTSIYTNSNTDKLPYIENCGVADTQQEMPKIFRLSKINLNMTSKPIKSGLPLRIWDVMACGGFMLTNYQNEIPEYFTIGEHLEVYTSEDDLIEKCDYYLKNEEKRKMIAQKGYERVKEHHTTEQRLFELVKLVMDV